MNNGYLLVPGRAWPVNVEYPSATIAVPDGTMHIRFSLVAFQPMRERAQFGGRMRALWTDSTKSRMARAGIWQLIPRKEWTALELAEGLPKTGHKVGEPYGIVPLTIGPFEYISRDSPAVDGNDRPDWATHAFVVYELWGGNDGGAVYAAVVVEAFAQRLDSEIVPLEFVNAN